METLALILLVAGIVISVIGGIWFLIVAFSESIFWGVGCLFIPLVSLIFLILHWREAAKPFIVSLIGALLTLTAEFVAPETIALASM